MNLPDVPLISMLRERMSWLHQRQDVLSQNVANADTPSFVARDLKPLDFDDMLKRRSRARPADLTVTDPRHIAITPSRHRANSTTSKRRDVEANPNGNSVRWKRK